MKYKIKQRIVQKPEIELPEGSLIASVKHRGAFEFLDAGVEIPEMWEVIWLEPEEA